MSARLLALLHADYEPLGRFEQWFAAAGASVDAVVLGAAAPSSLESYDGLVVMGGPQSACGPDHEPFAGERALIRAAVGTGRGYLGVCLGAQLLAASLGGRVEPGTPERGVLPVVRTEAGASDLWLEELSDVFTVGQWHGDAITTLPSGAIHLAESEACAHQAFRVGERAWGLQFHPEVTPDIMRTWSTTDGHGEPESLAADVERWRADGSVDELWGRAVARFVRLLG